MIHLLPLQILQVFRCRRPTMVALCDCFFRLQDIYQPQGGEPHPRFIAPAHAVGSRIDCLDPRFGPRAVVPLTRDNPDHSGCEGVRPVFCLMNDRPFALKPVISEMAPTSRPLKTGVRPEGCGTD